MRPLRERSRLAGYRKPVNIGALAAGATAQYDVDSDELKPGIQARGEFNTLSVLNNSDADIHVDLDFLQDKRKVVVAHSQVSWDNMVPYLGLNVTNASSATAISSGQVWITIGNERDVLRERA